MSVLRLGFRSGDERAQARIDTPRNFFAPRTWSQESFDQSGHHGAHSPGGHGFQPEFTDLVTSDLPLSWRELETAKACAGAVGAAGTS